MASPSIADRRLVNAIVDLIGSEAHFESELSGLLVDVKRCIKEAQKADQLEARAHGRDAKMDPSVTWMGGGLRAQDALLLALRSDEVQGYLAMKGFSIEIREVAEAPIVVSVTRNP
jgi:hypothetical protein